MASFFRWRIADKIIPVLKKTSTYDELLRPSVVSTFVRVNRSSGKQPQLFIPLEKLTDILPQKDNLMNPKEFVRLLRNQGLPTAEGFIDITLNESPLSVVFTVDKHVFSKIILMDICSNDEIMAKSSCLFQKVSPKKVIVDCCLPKVGETFKMAHFRSAIHANFIANINKTAGHNVTKVTHIQDWSLESAFLLTGFHHFGSKEELLQEPSQHLSEVSKAAISEYRNNQDFKNEVNHYFKKMKEGDIDIISKWNYLKNICQKQLDSIYEKIGLTFDDVLFDSSYSSEIEEIEKDLLRKKLIVIQDDGKVKVNINSDNEEDSDYIFKVEIDTSPLLEPASQNLIKHLSRFDEMVYKSYVTLEPCIILQYLFSLWYFIDKASNVMKIDIKEKRLIVLKARLMLYEATLKTLRRGLYLLGITPYETNYSPPDFVKNDVYKNNFNK
ncbi:putative arginine--tRNA ligase, mitochondrial [Nephila pilipes]|uniref:Probable arginine--tRNA ligase, mitochondrial n=1 Tax=Nephila pilipes TaxID=299642 RepID=A0A8X6T536_NEPPI|nr:putative arginine--tRNA ligase, mitochondrial [Nephila pilipes]